MVRQLPPLGLCRRCQLPPRQVHAQRHDHVQWHRHLLRRDATVVPVLPACVARTLAPQAHHGLRAVGGHDTAAAVGHFMRGAGIAAGAPAVAELVKGRAAADLCGAVLQQVPVVRRDHDNPASLARFAQQRHQQLQVFERPALMQADPAHSGGRPRRCRPRPPPSAAGLVESTARTSCARFVAVGQVTLVEQRGGSSLRLCDSNAAWVANPVFSLAAVPSARRPHSRLVRLTSVTVGNAARPINGRPTSAGTISTQPETVDAGEQLTVDAGAQAVHHQQQHRLARQQWGRSPGPELTRLGPRDHPHLGPASSTAAVPGRRADRKRSCARSPQSARAP
jgi:hypothetical protein